MRFILYFALTILLYISVETTSPTVKSTKPPTLDEDSSTQTVSTVEVTTAPVLTTTSLDELCTSLNSSCENCVGNPKCLYCKSNTKCVPYPVGNILPKSSLCALSDARWGQCWVNFEALIITMGVIGGVILLSLMCCIYCCCCRNKKNPAKWRKEDDKIERKREERKLKQDERKADRKTKTDEIRKKYGLMKDDTPYQRFDA